MEDKYYIKDSLTMFPSFLSRKHRPRLAVLLAGAFFWWETRPYLRRKAEAFLEKAKPIFGVLFAGE